MATPTTPSRGAASTSFGFEVPLLFSSLFPAHCFFVINRERDRGSWGGFGDF